MKVAAYARYSSDNQRDLSIVAQLRAMKDYAAASGHTIVKVYQDEARSATSDNRPQFLEMMHDLTSGDFEAVMVHKLDRFARDRFDAAYYRKSMKKQGIRLLSVVEHLDDSPESVMFESIIDGMNEYYSRNLSREVMKGMKETAYQCKHTGGIPPLGYDVTPEKTYTINAHEADAVRLIFSHYASGEGYSAILDALVGYRTKSGQPFVKNSLSSILLNEKYTGVFIFNRTLQKINGQRNNRKSKPANEVIRIEGGMPAIIDRATWEATRQRMESNKHRQAQYTAKRSYLLTGKIFCGKCGGAMNGMSANTGRNKAEYVYYECSTRKRKHTCDMRPINRDYIEGKVIEALRKNLLDPAIIDVAVDRIYDYARSSDSELPKKLLGYRHTLAGVEVDIKNIVDAVAKGMYHESMKDRLTDLEDRKRTMIAQIGESEEKLGRFALTKDDIRDFLSRWTHVRDPDEYRQAVRIFVERVTVYDDFIDIDVFSPDISTTPRRGSPPPTKSKFHDRLRVGITEYRRSRRAVSP